MILRIGIILMVIAAIVAIPAVILANSNDNEEEVTDMDGNVSIPLIDTMRPAVTETATFALG